ncbi:MAG: FUN14 domain-containing protein [Planctomycetota bacterium]
MSDEAASAAGEVAQGAAGVIGQMSLVQRALVALSGVVMAAGVGLGIAGPLASETPAPRAEVAAEGPGASDAGDAADAASGFVGDGGGIEWPDGLPRPGPSEPEAGEVPADADEFEDGEASTADPWSPAIFRMGFSFFVGFAVAYAVRAFVKVSLIGLGMVFLLLFGLQYAGFVEVKWDVIGDRYDSTQAWLGGQISGFTAFATGYLPSAGAAVGGLAFGFKRK